MEATRLGHSLERAEAADIVDIDMAADTRHAIGQRRADYPTSALGNFLNRIGAFALPDNLDCFIEGTGNIGPYVFID